MTLRIGLTVLLGLIGAARLGAQQATTEFQPGDVIRLDVEGDTVFTGTFTVGPGPALALPVIGEIPLAGVRRADVESYLLTQLGRYLRNPVVHAKALIRVSILGEVAKPGIYAVPTDLVLGDAIMIAGGPTQEAKFAATRIDRGDRRLVDEQKMADALARGLTLDDLNLRAGDRILVPREERRDAESKWRIAGLLATLTTTIYLIAK
jgi:polysaccharide export outer membrane protein